MESTAQLRQYLQLSTLSRGYVFHDLIYPVIHSPKLLNGKFQKQAVSFITVYGGKCSVLLVTEVHLFPCLLCEMHIMVDPHSQEQTQQMQCRTQYYLWNILEHERGTCDNTRFLTTGSHVVDTVRQNGKPQGNHDC